MSLTVSESSGFKSVPPGTYQARCIRLIDIGTQEGEYNGKKLSRNQVIIVWELPTELIDDGDYAGEPYIISKFFTASLSDRANLRKYLETWRGKAFTPEELKGFKLQNILDKPCMLSIIHSETGRAKIGGVMALPKGMIVPSRINPLVSFDITDWDANVYNSLTDGIKRLIQSSHEVQNGNNASDIKDIPVDTESDIEPF